LGLSELLEVKNNPIPKSHRSQRSNAIFHQADASEILSARGTGPNEINMTVAKKK